MTPLDVAKLLENTPDSLRQLLSPCDDALAQWKPQTDAWCINEVIGHLIWADEWAFAKRIQTMTSGSASRLEPLDVQAAAAARKDDQKPLEDVFEEFIKARAQHVIFIKALDPNLLSRSAAYKDYGMFLASDFLYEWPFHDYGHIAQIMRILRAHLKPRMSDVMQFALEN